MVPHLVIKHPEVIVNPRKVRHDLGRLFPGLQRIVILPELKIEGADDIKKIERLVPDRHLEVGAQKFLNRHPGKRVHASFEINRAGRHDNIVIFGIKTNRDLFVDDREHNRGGLIRMNRSEQMPELMSEHGLFLNPVHRADRIPQHKIPREDLGLSHRVRVFDIGKRDTLHAREPNHDIGFFKGKTGLQIFQQGS
ncbi:MAG: hypothetical protein BWY44_00252 [Candidatus Omnitrophica bacterium ADurb.Bin292]|nr:MAG: hypothetical protein BWY44_00252 [Candidatus Omnitrophica bacterium ADurb.Bin292]